MRRRHALSKLKKFRLEKENEARKKTESKGDKQDRIGDVDDERGKTKGIRTA